MAKAEEADGQKQKEAGKGHKKLKIFLIALVVLFGVLFALYEMYGSLPSSVLSAVNSGKPLNATVLEGIVLQKVNASPMFSANYTGNITINNGSDPSFHFSFLKYYNATRYTFSVTGLYHLQSSKNVSILYITNSSNSMQNTLCAEGVPVSIGTVAGSYTCFKTYNNWTQEAGIANLFVNVSSINNVATTSYGVSLYNGQPCYSVSGTGTIGVNGALFGASSSGEIPMGLTFSACLSAQYNIPLYISAYMTGANGRSVSINLNESAIGMATNSNQVMGLP